MPTEQDKAIAAIAKENFLAYCFAVMPKFELNWHLELLANKLQQTVTSKNQRLMVFMPPRHGKSNMCSLLFPAWFLGRSGDKQLIATSYSHTLAASFGRDVRNLIQEPSYKFIFPNTELAEDSQSKDKFHTKEGGVYVATGRGAMTGFGADLLLIDDPIADEKEARSEIVMDNVWSWYTSAARTRLMPGGSIVIINTRWGDDDLAGRILEIEGKKEDGGVWDVLSFPAIAEQKEQYRDIGAPLWPSRYDLETLLAVKKSVGVEQFSCLYQQNPINSETAEFKAKWFQKVRPSRLPQGMRIVTTIDLAISKKTSADYTVIITLGISRDNHKFILEVTRKKMDLFETGEELFRHHKQYHSDIVGIESVAYQQAFSQYVTKEMVRRNQFMNIVEIKTRSNKEEKIRGLIPHYKAGAMWHLEGADGIVELENELLRFPKGRNDDCADALAMGMEFWNNSGLGRARRVLDKGVKTIKQLLRDEGLANQSGRI